MTPADSLPGGGASREERPRERPSSVGEERSTNESAPDIHYATWDAFQEAINAPEPSAIDVLSGEPGDMPAFATRPKLRGAQRQNDGSVQSSEAPPPPPPPERIRINSKGVIRILSIIHRTALSPGGQPLLLFRPYRALVGFQEEIRHWVSRLEKKCGRPSREFGEESNRGSGEQDLESSDGDDYVDNGFHTPGTLHDLRCLLQILERHVRPRLDYVRGPGCHLVTFSDLWLLFSPGDLVVRRDERQVYRVVGISTLRVRKGGARRPGWSRFAAKTSPLALEDSTIIIECVYIDCDGQEFGPVRQSFSVDSFEGETEITSLDVFPLRLLASEKVENLAKRGRRVLHASKIEIMHHEGLTIDTGLHACGSVVIDPKEALVWGDSGFERPEIHRFHPPKAGFLWQRTGAGEENEDDVSDSSAPQLAPDEVSVDDRSIEVRCGSAFVRGQMGKERERIGSSSLAVIPRPIEAAGDCPEEDLFVVHYRVFGFLLETQAWAQLDIDNLTAVDASVYEDKLNELVLPSGHKEALNSLIRHYSFATKSIVILLHGPPGLGKSSTAEYVAGLNGKPLLQLLPRGFGTIEELNKTMETQLRRAVRWGCCTLLRELDTIGDAERSSLERWETFVRFLDRWEGVVILISAQVCTMPVALRSRLHLSLYYPPLTKTATLQIFRVNIDRVTNRRGPDNGPSDLLIRVDTDKILDFASAHYDRHRGSRWSGKRIRTDFDSALALAIYEAENQQPAGYGDGARSVVLTVDHFEKVAMSLLDFDKYLLGELHADMYDSQVEERQLPAAKYPFEPQWLPQQNLRQRGSSNSESSSPESDHVPGNKLQSQPSFNFLLAPSPLAGARVDKLREVHALMPTLTNTQSKRSTPKLKFVDWEVFKAGRGRSKEAGFAIEVLLGDPVVDLSEEAAKSVWWARWSEGSQKNHDGSARDSAGKRQRDPGHSAVPERIRIRSEQIVTSLSSIFGSPLSRHGEAVVMMRPYRALIYHRDRIQRELERLEALGSDPSHTERSASGPLRVPSVSAGPSSSEELGATTATDESMGHLRCLVTLLETTVDARARYLTSSRCNLITFADLWQLFKPGDEIFSEGSKQAFRVVSVNSTFHCFLPPWQRWEHKAKKEKGSPRPSVVIQFVCVDFDGTMIGPTLHQEEIEEFDGEKPVRALAVYPLRFANMNGLNRSTLRVPHKSAREALIARGREFLDVVRIKPRHYNGLTTDTKEEIDSQVVVDFEQADAEGKGRRADRDTPPIYSLIGKEIGVRQTDGGCAYDCCSGDNIHNDSYIDNLRNAKYISSCIPTSEGLQPTAITEELSLAIHPRALSDIDPAKVSDDDLVIMSAHVYGFVLRSRKWAKLDVESLSPIGSQGRDLGQAQPSGTGDGEQDITSDAFKQPIHTKESINMPSMCDSHRRTAFDLLVLPDGHKEIVMSLVGQHFHDRALKSQKNQEVDIVRGKGKGLIILLHGAPGVGKTTTAEGVAEAFNKPLFQITCGDLGTTAVDVENALERHFALASRWDCVLLLDEADVFMAERSPQDFKRNSFVTVFLRVLEYYTGILFLTTNRIGDFDEAFSSRIHVSLYYPPLQLEPTLEIFRLNLNQIRKRTAEWARRARGQQQQQQAATDIDEEDILRFASKYWKSNKKMRWNGRQIRNGCQTALALAEYEAQRGVGGDVTAADHAAGEAPSSSLPPVAAASGSSSRRVVVNARAEALRKADSSAPVHLTSRHLEIVSEAYLGFMRYLKDVHGRDAERRAKYMGIRARELAHNLSETRKDTERANQLGEDENDEDDGGENGKATAAGNNEPGTANVGAGGPKTADTGSPSVIALTTPSGSRLQSPRPLQPVPNPLHPLHQQQLQTQQPTPNLQGFHQPPLQHTPHGHPTTSNVQPPPPAQVSLAMPMLPGGAFNPQMFQQSGSFVQQQQAQSMAAFAGMGQPPSPAQLLATAQQQQQQLQQLQLQTYMMANPGSQLPQQQHLGQQQMPQQQPQQHQQQYYHDTSSSLGGGSSFGDASHGPGL
ncbi:hypothetical protein MAPG_10912 [Magnaporthiopsis poae ATCC 64411]|uniref:AAA+ ATPase domain-containing protein n=1 Tax=Magnaporthiopsis poae (strain ATCC 64411 / 73-15) TaxID=644358 RepID=A0A0C4EDV1_MAGP6|nr:hypothetical protein MAPG_10912 [Magnaporthiopsis poae ATCC 64411]